MASIKLHLQESHPLALQRIISLNLNEFACLHCDKQSNCKEMMQIHLTLEHPDEPAFVIKRKLKVTDCEDPVEDLEVMDISIDVLKTDIRILKDNEILNTVHSNKDHEVQDLLETVSRTVLNSQDSTISTVLMLNSPVKSSRLTDNSTINNQPGQRLEAEKKFSSKKLKMMEKTPFTKEDCPVKLSDAFPVIREMHQNEESQILENESIEPVQHDFVENDQPDQIQVSDDLEIQTTNEPLESMSIDTNQPNYLEHPEPILSMIINKDPNKQAQLENRKFEEAVSKEGERIKYLLEILVENTGVHTSTLYRCPHCNAPFMHFELWLKHIKNKHKNIEDTYCPYCTQKLLLEAAKSHFENHLRHEYICYYCITSYCSNEKIQEHFALCHDNCNSIELPIASFYLVLKQDDIISDYTALLEHFAEAIYLYLKKKIQCNTVNEWTGGLAVTCLDEMEIPKYKPEEKSLIKCFVKLCPFVASDENSFHDHLLQHEVPKTFECTYCNHVISYPSLESIKSHLFQHLSACLHVCCVCKFFHHNYDDMIKHIENLHNSRDVPVIYLLRGSDSNFKVSLSIFLPPNKISFVTSKACFCCEQELRNGNKYIDHLKKVHKLFLCPRCQLCDKIILTHLDGESHYREHHKMESFKLKYEVLTPYLYNLILTTRSPLTVEISLKKEKSFDQQVQSNPNETKSSSVAVKEEITVKGELEEETQAQKISLKCLHTNQLFENQFGKDASTKEVPSLPQTAIPQSTQNTAPPCSFPSPSQLRSLSYSKSKNVTTTETQTSNCALLNSVQESLQSSQTQHVVIQNIQLETGNAILSIPVEKSTTATKNRTVDKSQRIPVITRTRAAQSNILQEAAPPASLAMQSYTSPLTTNVSVQANKPNLVEIAPICGNCNFECIDFVHLQAHFEATHAIYNQRFYFYVNRKIGCVYCRFQGTVKSFTQHLAISHPGRLKLCFSLRDSTRCGICDDLFRYPSSSLTPICACPGYQRTIADCLDLPTLKTLQDIGYQYYKYSCHLCELSFPSAPYLTHHYISVHHQFIDPELWRNKLKYYCFACPSVVSYNLFEVVYHMRYSHLLTMALPMSQRYEFYKKIKIGHPNGLLISLDDLRNTGEFDEESLKQIIYNFEAL